MVEGIHDRRDAPRRAVFITGSDIESKREIGQLYNRIVYCAFACRFGTPQYLNLPHKMRYDELLGKLIDQEPGFLESSVMIADLSGDEADIAKNNLCVYLLRCEALNVVPNVVVLTAPKARIPQDLTKPRDDYQHTFVVIEHTNDDTTVRSVFDALCRIVGFRKKLYAEKQRAEGVRLLPNHP